MTDEVDPQARRVYAAEDAVIDEVGPRWRRWRDVEGYLDSILADHWLHEAFENAPLEITLERRSHSATASLADAERCVIWILDGSWNALTLLHELAHVVAPPDSGHGTAFVAAELELVRRFCGFEPYIALRASLDRHSAR